MAMKPVNKIELVLGIMLVLVYLVVAGQLGVNF